MDKLTKVIIGVLGVLAIVFGTLYFATPHQTIVNNPPFGAVAVLQSPVEVNGHQMYIDRKVMTQSTSTPCTFRSSVSASSTLVYASARFETATGTALYVDIGRSATPYATTSVISSMQITGGAKETVYATTSAGVIGINANTRFKPGDYLVVKVSAPEATTNIHTNPTGFVPVGTCNAVWESDN